MRLVLEFSEAFNRHDIAGMLQLVSNDCVFETTHPAPDGTRCVGKEAIAQHLQDFFRESPHARLEIEEIFGVGTRCVMRYRYNWIDAAGNAGHISSIDVYQVKNHLISEKLSYVKG